MFLLHFFNGHILNVNYAKFQKRFDSRNNFKGITLNVWSLGKLDVSFVFLES